MAKLSKEELEKRMQQTAQTARNKIAQKEHVQFRMEPEKIQRLFEISAKKQQPVSALLRDWVSERIAFEDAMKVSHKEERHKHFRDVMAGAMALNRTLGQRISGTVKVTLGQLPPSGNVVGYCPTLASYSVEIQPGGVTIDVEQAMRQAYDMLFTGQQMQAQAMSLMMEIVGAGIADIDPIRSPLKAPSLHTVIPELWKMPR